MKWSEKVKVNFHDTDKNEILSVSHMFKYIQESAMRQMKAQKPSYTDLLNENKSFVLSAIRLEIYSTVYAYEDVEARTWASGGKGLNFMRSYDIVNSDGKVVCEANSAWALVSTNEKKFYSVNDINLEGYCVDEPVNLERPLRIRISQSLPLSLVGEYTVRYSDIDINGHMNNTNYPDMICDFIPDIENLRITSIGINYSNEAKYKENLKIYMTKVDNKYYFKTVRSDGKVNIEAEVVTESMWGC